MLDFRDRRRLASAAYAERRRSHAHSARTDKPPLTLTWPAAIGVSREGERSAKSSASGTPAPGVRPSMALAVVGEALVSVVLKEVSRKLGSAIGQQIKARWNLERDMEDIKNTLGIVQAVLRDAERRSVREEAVNLWLKMLKDAAYDISDMFDEFEDKLSKVNLLTCAVYK